MHTVNHPTVSLNHIFELFDTLIRPILRYGCAVWGCYSITEIEKYHLQFIKRTLGVKMTTNSSVVYAETGIFPLHIYINVRMIKYWFKILNGDTNKLIHIAYMKCFNIQKEVPGLRTLKTYYAAMALNIFGKIKQ